MKTKLDLDEIEKSINYEEVTKRLETLTTSGNFTRRKKVTDLLEKLKPALLRARENKVPLKTLASFVRESGIPITDANFQKYLRNINPIPVRTKKRKKIRSKSENLEPVLKQPLEKTETVLPPKNEPSAMSKKLPPRLAKRST
jgi:hypothetical protein